MTAVKVFLVGVYVTGLTLSVLALLYGAGTSGTILYNLGAVIAVTAAVVAMWPRLLNYINPKEEDQ